MKIVLFGLLVMSLLGVVASGRAGTLTVTTLADSGDGTLRQAILDANADASPDLVTIEFNIPGAGVRTIAPLTPLPIITRSVRIDGYTQPGASPNTLADADNAVLRVELSGDSAGASAYGLRLAASGCTVRGLVINRFTTAAGILLEASGNSVIEGNFIGTDASGTQSRGNLAGVVIHESMQNLVGGTAAGAGNLISGNSAQGVFIDGLAASNNVVVGNFIGTDSTGTNALANETGIFISGSPGNRIGGLTPASRNTLSGNLYGISLNVVIGAEILGNYVGLGADGVTVVSNLSGIFLHYCSQTQIGGSAPGARNVISGNAGGCSFNVGSSNVIQGNYIGTDASGTQPRPNVTGIGLNESSHNLIGGSDAGSGNLLSGNSSAGVSVNGLSASNNIVAGNLIGTEVTGTTALGNGDYGVFIGAASGNVIGGTAAGARNVISGSRFQGVAIYYGGAGNVIEGNFIGTDAIGAGAISNLVAGVLISGSPGNRIGGTTSGAGNLIAFSTYAGVAIIEDSATNNAIFGNSIFAIGALGVDLALDGVTPNDSDDADGSPNYSQNFPEFASAALISGELTVRYLVDSVLANSAYPLTVEFFLADSAVSGQGRALIHRHIYDTAQAFTNITFTPAAAVNDGDPLVATATDANGNTSEFSAAAIATANHSPVVLNLIPNQSGTYGSAFSYSFPANTFDDPDAGDLLSYSASGLPPGLAFDGATRTFSGTNTVLGSYTVTITTTDNGAPALGTNDFFDVTVLPAPLTVTVDNKRRLPDQGNPPFTGALVGVTNGDAISVTFETTALPESPPGNYPITAVFSDLANRLPNYTVTANPGTLTVIDCSTLAITNAALPNALKGAAYNVTLRARNGTAPDTFAITSGTLPGNLSLATGGLLSGTATNAGTFPITIAASSAVGCVVTSNYVLTVVCPAITVLPDPLPDGTRNRGYSQTMTASGGVAPYAFAVTGGSLPPGLSLSTNGVLSGGMNLTRSSHTATMLPNGKLLVAGGQVSFGASASTELYDPASGTWTLTGALNHARRGHTATMLANGKVLVVAGIAGSGALLATAELYNPATGTWTATGVLNHARDRHTATLLSDGKVLVAGGAGVGGTAASAELYDPGTGTWTAAGDLISSRNSHTATLLPNGQVLVAGGYDAIFPPYYLSNAELYDPANGTWTATAALNTGREFHTAALLPNGKVMVAGGLGTSGLLPDTELYDTATGAWTLTGAMATGRAGHAATLLTDGNVLVAGGDDVGSAELFDPVLGTWRATSPTTIARGQHTTSLLPNGKVLVAGGPGNSVELYDSVPGTWTAFGLPRTAGSFSFTVTATDSGGCTGSHSFDVNISCSPFAIGPATLPVGTVSGVYSQTLHGISGQAPYSFAVTAGALPPGLILSGAGGLSGTPTVAGAHSFTVTATDAGNCTGSASYSLPVTTDNRWVGDGGPNEWNFATPNWTKGLYHDGDDILFDDGGSASAPVNIATVVAPASVLVNATKTYTFGGAGGISGATALIKTNTGVLILATSNSFSGNTRVSDGRLVVQHNNALGSIAGRTTVTNNGSLDIDGSGLNIPEPLSLNVPYLDDGFAPTNGALNNLANTNTWSGPITLGIAFGPGPGIRSAAGLLTLNSVTPIAGPNALRVEGPGDVLISSAIGTDVPYVQAYGPGTLTLMGTNFSANVNGGILVGSSGRVVTSPAGLGVGYLSCGGTLEIDAGGSASVSNPLIVGGGKLRVSGGTVTYSRSGYPTIRSYGGFETAASSDRLIINSPILQQPASPGELYISGPGTVIVNSGHASVFETLHGFCYLYGGILQLNHLNALGHPGAWNYINMSGGALRTGVDAGGAFSTYGIIVEADATIQPGRSTPGQGVSNYFGDLRLLVGRLTVVPGPNLNVGSTADLGFGTTTLEGANGLLEVKNEGGVNARLTLTGLISDYLARPLIKSGSGTLVLSVANTYRGGTTVSNGTLRVSNPNGSATGSSNVTVLDGATLTGTGRISRSVTIESGGTLAPGNAIGNLAISNSLVFAAGATNLVEVNLNTRTNDLVMGLTNVTYGGTLVVVNVGLQAFTNGASFKLFASTSYAGNFASIAPSIPAAGLEWDVSSLAVDGKLKVVTAVNQPPPVIGLSFTGGVGALTWPSGPSGFELESTPTLTPPNWQVVTDGVNQSGGVNSYAVTNDLTASGRFFRLRVP